MQVSGAQKKIETFQDFYFELNGVKLSYREALQLFYQMDEETKSEFEKYYEDEVGYKIVSASGYNLDGKNSKNDITVKYTLEAYAKENGMILDPQWAIYSAEEILAMVNNGVVIPQEVVDVAQTIMNNSPTTASSEGEGQTSDELSFLEAIPEAQTKIEKCEENNEKINKEIQDLLPETNKRKKIVLSEEKKQRATLNAYEDNIREWKALDDKLKKGENLSQTDTKRYQELTKILQANKAKNEDDSFNKEKLASSLNELNLLSVIGEKLADETIMIGDTLADYTSKTNFKATASETIGQIGFFRAIISMVQGKLLAKEANIIGNDTKAYSEETAKSVNEISEVMDIELNKVQFDENGEVIIPEGNENPKGENKEEDVFVIDNESVLELLKEATDINGDTLDKIKESMAFIKTSKLDTIFTKLLSKKVDYIINNFKNEEARRQQEIQDKEQEKANAEKEIEKLTGEKPSNKDNKTQKPQLDKDTQAEVDKCQEIIDNNKQDIDTLKTESAVANEDVKKDVAMEKNYINKAVPEEVAMLEKANAYSEVLPEIETQLDFTADAGLILAEISTIKTEMGIEYMLIGDELMMAPITVPAGLALIVLGSKKILEGAISMAIGLGAAATAESGLILEEKSSELNKSAIKNITTAIDGLNQMDEKIISVTGDEAALAGVAGTEGDDNNDGNDDSNDDGNGSDNGNNGNNGEAPTIPEPTTDGNGTASPTATTEPSDTPSTPPTAGDNGTASPANKAPAGGRRSKKEEEQNTDPKALTKAVGKQNKVAKDGQKSVDKIAGSSKKDAKTAKKEEKDAQKDEKQLEKEAKQLEKQILKEQQDIVALTKESEKAVEKQQVIMAEYLTLSAESETLTAEDEAKQASAPRQASKQNNEQGGTPASNSFSVTEGSGSSNNQDKLEQNSQRINMLGAEFKLQDRVVGRNKTKINKKEKTIKTKAKKFQKKTKLRTKKLKEAQKAELDKQKRLNQQLAIVGIIGNVFSITSSIGTLAGLIGKGLLAIGTPMLSNPVTAAIGAALVTAGTWLEVHGDILLTIGAIGTAACGVTKGIIQIANGNTAGGLMAIGSAMISAATSLVGAGGATSSALQQVSAGLSVVSSSAELANNVRVAQGKEANATLSKISAIAGAASAVTGAASSIGNMGNQNVIGKISTIASVTGTALASTSQIMTEFNLGDQKVAEIFSIVGSSLQTVGSIGQLAVLAGSKSKTSDTKTTTDDTTQNQNSNNSEAKVQNGKLIGADGKEIKIPEGCKIADNKVVDANGKEVKIGADGKNKTQQPTAQKKDTTAATSDKAAAAPADKNPAAKEAKEPEVKAPETSSADNKEAADALRSEDPTKKAGENKTTTTDKKEDNAPASTKDEAAMKEQDSNSNTTNKQPETPEEKAQRKADFRKKNMEENGASEEFADVDDALLDDYRQEALGEGDETMAKKYEEEQKKRAEFKENKAKEAKRKTFNQIVDLTGQVVNAGTQVASMLLAQDEGETKTKIASPGRLNKRTREIIKKNDKFRKRRVSALAKSQRYYA